MASPTGTNPIEKYQPEVLYNGGLYTALPVLIANDLTVTGTTNIGGVSLSDLTTTGNTTLGNAVSDTTAINGATTITSTSASALTVGRQGATAPVLKINAATSTVATGIEVTGAAAAGGIALAAISSASDESLKIDAKGTGTVTINGTATGIVILPAGTTIGGSTVSALGVITSASATALAVGLNGATNSAFVVDSSTGSQAAGLKITGATAAGTVAEAVISSGADASLSINAKGSGTVTINNTATGNIVLGRAATGVSLGLTGAASMKTATAVPATAGAVAAGAPLVLNSDLITIEATTDVPTHARPKGSLCINLGGSSTSTRLYVATDAAGTWTAVTTAG